MNISHNRIGIFGGTFDPIHIGHLILAEHASEEFALDTVYFMPCADQPLKPEEASASGNIRREMITAAIAGNPKLGLLDIELVRGGTSYTVDSLEELAIRFPAQERVFLIGGDKLQELHKWKDISRVGELCRFGIFPRPGAELAVPSNVPENVQIAFAQSRRQFDVSSSYIRRRVAEGLSIRYLVPREVEQIIFERHIYRA